MTSEEVGIYVLLLCEQWEGGPIPDNDEELVRFTRTSASNARAILQQCFSLASDGWTNPELLEIREEQEIKRGRRASAGSKGGKKKAENRLAMLEKDPSNALAIEEKRVEESRVEEKRKKKKEHPQGGVEGNNILRPDELLAEWIKRQHVPPDQSEKSKQAGKAKQICAKHSKDDISQAFLGMGELFPYSNGEPWDLFDLDKKFSKAKQAVVNHPKVQEMKRDQELAQELEGV